MNDEQRQEIDEGTTWPHAIMVSIFWIVVGFTVCFTVWATHRG